MSIAAWKDPDFIRTHDPFHSFMVWGKGANELKQIDNESTFGCNSVFGWLHQNRAKMLIIDLHLSKSFTFVHYCEEKINVKYRKHVKHKINYIDENGNQSVVEKLFFTRKSGYLNYLDDLEKYLYDEGFSEKYLFNNSKFLLINDLWLTYKFINDKLYPKGELRLHKFSYKIWFKYILKKMLFMRG